MGGRAVDSDAGPGRDLRQDWSDGHVDGVRSLLHGLLHAKLAQDTSSPNAGLCWCGLHMQRSVQSTNRWANYRSVTEMVAGWSSEADVAQPPPEELPEVTPGPSHEAEGRRHHKGKGDVVRLAHTNTGEGGVVVWMANV